MRVFYNNANGGSWVMVSKKSRNCEYIMQLKISPFPLFSAHQTFLEFPVSSHLASNEMIPEASQSSLPLQQQSAVQELRQMMGGYEGLVPSILKQTRTTVIPPSCIVQILPSHQIFEIIKEKCNFTFVLLAEANVCITHFRRF